VIQTVMWFDTAIGPPPSQEGHAHHLPGGFVGASA